MTRVLAFVPDLMDRSRVAGAAKHRVRFAASPGELVRDASEADLVVADLSRDGVFDVLAEVVACDPGPRVIGFGSHVDRELLARARLLGLDEVLTRSAFFAGLPRLLA
jgi:hypothetical protein